MDSKDTLKVIQERLEENQCRQECCKEKINNKRKALLVIITQGIALSLAIAISIFSMLSNFGAFAAIAYSIFLSVILRKVVSLDEIQKIVCETKAILHANSQEELENLKTQEACLQEVLKWPMPANITSNPKYSEIIEQLKKDKYALLNYQQSQLSQSRSVYVTLEEDRVEKIEKVKRKGEK